MTNTLTATKTTYGKLVSTRPNWRSEATETYEFKTRVWQSRDRSEQRVAQREDPRISVSFRRDAMEARARKEYREFQDQHNDTPSVLPVPWRSVGASEITAADTTITLASAAPWWMSPGGWIVIESDDALEAAEIASVAGSTVTVTAGLQAGHTGAVRVQWGLSGFMEERRRLRSVVSGHLGGTVQFNAKPGTDGRARPVLADPPYLAAYPILLQRPDWSEEIQMDLSDLREQVDYGSGPTSEYFFNQFADLTVEWQFTALNRQQADDMIAFFIARRGRQKPFWATTYKRDVELSAVSLEGSSALAVVGDHTAFDGDPIHRGVMVRWPDGNRQANLLTGAGNGTLSFEYAWARDVTTDATISWLFLGCFSSDELEVSWQTDGVATISVGISAVPQSPDISISGPEPLQVAFTYGGFGVSVWNTTITGWGQIDLGYEITAEDIAAGRGRASATYSGVMVYAPGLSTYSGRVNVAFYDADGDGVGGGGDSENWTFSGPRAPAPQDNPFEVSFGPVTVPERTRYIRFGGITNQGSEGISGLGSVTIFRDLGGSLITEGVL